MKKFLVILSMLVIASLALVACGGGDDKATNNNNTNTGGQSTPAGNVDPEKVFAKSCASCHGADLSGGAGPKLSDVGSRLTKDQILSVIQNGQGFMGANIIVGEEAEAVATWLSEKK